MYKSLTSRISLYITIKHLTIVQLWFQLKVLIDPCSNCTVHDSIIVISVKVCSILNWTETNLCNFSFVWLYSISLSAGDLDRDPISKFNPCNISVPVSSLDINQFIILRYDTGVVLTVVVCYVVNHYCLTFSILQLFNKTEFRKVY